MAALAGADRQGAPLRVPAVVRTRMDAHRAAQKRATALAGLLPDLQGLMGPAGGSGGGGGEAAALRDLLQGNGNVGGGVRGGGSGLGPSGGKANDRSGIGDLGPSDGGDGSDLGGEADTMDHQLEEHLATAGALPYVDMEFGLVSQSQPRVS